MSDPAQERLRRVVEQDASLPRRAEPELLQSNSNDVWRLGGIYLRICWRGDRARLAREAAVASALPDRVPYPAIVAVGEDDALSWMATTAIDADNLGHVWSHLERADKQRAVRARMRAIRALHRWTPPADVAALLERSAPFDPEDARSIAGTDLNPLPLDRVRLLVSAARRIPHVPASLLDATSDLLDELAPHDPYSTGEELRVVHGDASIFNVLWSEGRLRALLDFEWVRWGSPDMELLALVHTGARRGARAREVRMLARWMSLDYPEIFGRPDLGRRLWLHQVVNLVRALCLWPPTADDAPSFPVRGLRRVLEGPTEPVRVLAAL